MSSKTQILSFDDALSNHKKVLTESLINFDEGQRVRKIMLDINSNSADYEYYFQSGQQSKQDEIDGLQKRIDYALNVMCKLQYSSGERIYDEVGKILKGEETK